ncbi:DUF2798 domain-containing protein [Marilutibacter spongiae]|uniref:DUF2798 domain-containing protein n=1 Tax=Marilutibacter spongiae TaxID=2025720 RepID=A0A7W3Y707_9GAMM|nr:DUF2798 domain-containing protein [Lysobacter spongiae]MBB1061590.1 hypothetical protein [Lysobacter spongiae]
MLPPRLLRRVYLPTMLIALLLLGGVAVSVVHEGLMAGRAEAWMVAWVLAFVLGLPALLLLLPSLGALVDLARSRDNVPYAGGKIP